MRPCRGLLPSRACRQRHWVCDRAVGERCTTESIASIHKLHHWCRDVHTVHKICGNAINRTKNPILVFLTPISKILSRTLSSVQRLNPSSYIEPARWKQCYLPHAHIYKHVHTPTQTQADFKAVPQLPLNPISAYCDHFSLSCSLQNNEIQLFPSDWRGMIVSAFEKTYAGLRGDVWRREGRI